MRRRRERRNLFFPWLSLPARLHIDTYPFSINTSMRFKVSKPLSCNLHLVGVIDRAPALVEHIVVLVSLENSFFLHRNNLNSQYAGVRRATCKICLANFI